MTITSGLRQIIAPAALVGVSIFAVFKAAPLLPYAFGILASLFLCWLIATKYGLAGLLILTAPINRLFIDVGFALKPYYIFVIGLFLINIWQKRDAVLTVTANRDFKIVYLLLSICISAIANGAPVVSLRHIVVFVFVFSGCYLLYQGTRSFADLRRLIDTYLVTGLMLGLSGLAFYAIFLVRPELVVEGSLFEGVTYDPKHPWTLPALQAVDIGSNGYAMTLLPFLLVSIVSMFGPGTRTRKLYAAMITTLLFINLFLTFSRGGMTSFLVATFALLFFARVNKWVKWGAAISTEVSSNLVYAS